MNDHTASDVGTKGAQLPHELFLINLLFNHVLLFIACISVPSLQFTTVIVPLISVGIMGFTLWKATRIGKAERLVYCHWQLAAKRTRIFALMWIALGVFLAAIYTATGGHPRPVHIAVGSLAFFPTMFLLLALVIMESESLQHARHGSLPTRKNDRCALCKD